MASLLQEGVCDAFGLGRPLLAEPDLANRWREDDARPAACISCNACLKGSEEELRDCPVMRDKTEVFWGTQDLD
jgi:2,4-dienoyl-CoA reductase-like NADH-dependent reductase (Old Yellow Enzyme family)